MKSQCGHIKSHGNDDSENKMNRQEGQQRVNEEDDDESD
jgi:hypothetical protein